MSPADARLRQILKRLSRPQALLETRTTVEPAELEELRAWLSRAAERDITLEVRLDPRLTTGARLVLGEILRIDLDRGGRLLARLEERTATLPPGEVRTLDQAAGFLAATLEPGVPGVAIEDLADRGWVLEVGDGVAVVAGLGRVGSQEVVRFEGGVDGIAFNLLEDAVGCLLLGPEASVRAGGAVERTGRRLHVPVGDALIGRVVDALGGPIDAAGPIASDRTRPLEVLSPGVVQRQPVAVSLHTGIKSLDALVPLGRGQRELILGDRAIGKTTLALDVILSQKDAGVVCVYAAIGQRATALARVVGLLRERGAMDHTIVVAARSGELPAFRHFAPFTACTIGEEFMRQGRHALVVYDDLSKHAVTYREISALLKRPIGREAYPGDIFYLHARLLERAAQLREDLGGGSLTAIPIVETLAGDVSALIPTNIISICDGQIVLDAGQFNEGFRPAMDVGLSVSRVGGMAQTPAMRKVAGRLRIDLAQYHEMARFVKFGAEVDEATLAQLARGARELEVLKQAAHTPLPLEREIVILFAAVHGYTDGVAVEQLQAYEAYVHEFMEREYPDVLAAIRDAQDLTPGIAQRLAAALTQAGDAFHGRLAAAPPAAG